MLPRKMTEWSGKVDRSSFRITIDLSWASGTKPAHFQTIFRYVHVPIDVWIYENGAKELDPKHPYFTLISVNF